MNERLKILRRALGLTQAEFGATINLKGNTITTYETGIREPSDAIIALICARHGVREAWLRNGEGEMFIKRSPDEELAIELGKILFAENADFKKRFITALLRLDDSGWKALERLVDELKKDPD